MAVCLVEESRITTMKLDTANALLLLAAINTLDGSQKVVAGPNGRPSVVVEPYDLSDKVKWNLAKNRRKLRELEEMVDEERRRLITELKAFTGMLDRDADAKENDARTAAKEAELDARLQAFLKQENEIDLLKIPAVGLKLKANRIMPSTIERLMDLIDGEPQFDDAAKPEPAKS